MAVENLLTDFGHALGAQRVSRARPSQRRLGLFVGLEQRLVRPLGRRRRILLDPVQPVENQTCASGAKLYCFFFVLNWLVHVSVYLSYSCQPSAVSFQLKPGVPHPSRV